MLRLECKILIADPVTLKPKYEYSYAHSIETSGGFADLTDTAKITLPRQNGLEDKNILNGINPLFKRGDKIEIWLGYFPTLKKAFTGYITQILPKIPMTILCEDEMWPLKKTSARKFTTNGCKLKELLTGILPVGFNFNALDINVGPWRVSEHSNVTNVLKELRTQSIYARMINGVLYAGLAVIPADQQTQIFYFEQNVIDDSSLEFQLVEEVKVKIKVNVFYPDNRKVAPYEFGDENGDLRTINLYNVPEADLKSAADRELARLKYTGYRGSFTTFGEPFIRPGDAAAMVSTIIPERNGNYLVKSVKRTFGMSGYRQEVELETKI